MKIEKYVKLRGNRYNVFLSDGSEIILYEDVILKFELLLTKRIDNIDEIKKFNEEYALYDKCLGYISKKIRSEKEIKEYLGKYTKNEELALKLIKKLKDNHYLNEDLYLRSYINDKLHLSLDGPLKIKKNLMNLGFYSSLIDEYLIVFTEDKVKERIERYIEKQLKTNKKSLYTFKSKMLMNLMNLGYERENILTYLNKISVDEDTLKEKEYEKLYQKYSKKYSGYELEQIIKNKLYQKGFK